MANCGVMVTVGVGVACSGNWLGDEADSQNARTSTNSNTTMATITSSSLRLDCLGVCSDTVDKTSFLLNANDCVCAVYSALDVVVSATEKVSVSVYVPAGMPVVAPSCRARPRD